jgi:Flp pilus assembly protein TadG
MFGRPAQAKVGLNIFKRATKHVAVIWPDQRGVSAIEFSIFAVPLFVGMLNATDISIYMFKRMELENATQMGAQAAWKACDTAHLPATTNCSGLIVAVKSAVQSTSLGSQVSLQSGSPSEGYYCVDNLGALEFVATVTAKPTDCSAVSMPNSHPADYVKIATTFPYAPLFPGITVTSSFTTPITKTALMRLD